MNPDKKSAHEVFLELKNAYESNDLGGVQKILDRLRDAKMFTDRSVIVSDKDLLKKEILVLRHRIENVLHKIDSLTSTDVWKTIRSTSNWKLYFEEQKKKLEIEIDTLKKEEENVG